MKFKHLNVPTHWRNYWSRYPEGHTILEALISWVSQVDSMVDNQNKLNDNVAQFRTEIDVFIGRFDERLQDEVTQTLNDWQTSGFLDVVISEALQWQLDDYIATNEADKLSLTAQLQQTKQELSSQLADIRIDVTKPPTPLQAIIGVGDETNKFKELIEYSSVLGCELYIPKEITLNTNTIIFDDLDFLKITCNGLIKRIQNSNDGAILRFKNSRNITIPTIHFDGNGLENGAAPDSDYSDSEQFNMCISFDNCHNVVIGDCYAHNSAGDIIYIANKSSNFNIRLVKATADEQIGRNVVSLINCKDINIGTIKSHNFSHWRMPGGLDIEPNNQNESVINVFVDNIELHGGGNAPLALLASNGGLTKNVYINNVYMVREINYLPTSTPESVYITASDVTINNLVVINNQSSRTPHFIRIDNHGRKTSNVKILNSYGEKLNTGISISKYFREIENVFIKAMMRDLEHDGVQLIRGNNITLDLDIKNVGEDRYYISKSGDYLTSNIYLSGDLSKNDDGTGYSCMTSNVDPIYLKNWKLNNLDMRGWTDSRQLLGNGFKGDIKKSNVLGLTDKPNRPSQGIWVTGDIIKNNTPTIVEHEDGDYIVDKWVYINDDIRFIESKVMI